MFRARTPDEAELLDEIARRFGGNDPSVPSPPVKPVGELVPLTDQEFDLVRSAIETQVAPIKEAYLRGMARAETDEQREILRELREVIGPPRDS